MSEPEVLIILLAEDSPADVMLVQRVLNEHAIRGKLRVLRDGAGALRFFRDLDYDLILRAPYLVLFDLHLPKHDGYEIIREVRASQRCAETPVVVMSASGSPEDRADAESHSARYFRKPAGLDALMELVTVIKQAPVDKQRERCS